MKKILSIIVVIFACVMLTSCANGNSPKGRVNSFCDAIKDMDFEKACDYTAYDSLVSDYTSFYDNEKLMPLFDELKKQSKKTSFKIIKADIDENDADIVVRFKYNDLSGVYLETFKDTLTHSILSVLGGNSIDEDDIVKIFKEAVKDTKISKTESEVEFVLGKDDDGEWKIVMVDPTIANVISMNMLGLD